MVPVHADLGGMAACGQEVAPTTLSLCHLHDGAGGHSKCGCRIEALVRVWGHGSSAEGVLA